MDKLQEMISKAQLLNIGLIRHRHVLDKRSKLITQKEEEKKHAQRNPLSLYNLIS